MEQQTIITATENWYGDKSDQFLVSLGTIFELKEIATSQLLEEVDKTISRIMAEKTNEASPIFVNGKLNLTFAEYTIRRVDRSISDFQNIRDARRLSEVYGQTPDVISMQDFEQMIAPAVDDKELVDLIVTKLAFLTLWHDAKESGEYAREMGRL